jgi:hypothetical protein
MLLESVHELSGLARSTELIALFCFVYMNLQYCQYHRKRRSAGETNNRCIELVHVLPLLIRMLHDVDLIVLKGSLVPNVGQDLFCI